MRELYFFFFKGEEGKPGLGKARGVGEGDKETGNYIAGKRPILPTTPILKETPPRCFPEENNKGGGVTYNSGQNTGKVHIFSV